MIRQCIRKMVRAELATALDDREERLRRRQIAWRKLETAAARKDSPDV